MLNNVPGLAGPGLFIVNKSKQENASSEGVHSPCCSNAGYDVEYLARSLTPSSPETRC
jgi:hypothetical protein